MKLWVLYGSYENEMFTSVHLTEKGCALACVADVLEFLGVEDEESALDAMKHYSFTETDGEQTEAHEWDFDKLKTMASPDIWRVFNDWCETCWEHMSDRDYRVEGCPQMVQA